MDGDLLEYAAPEIAWLVSGEKKFMEASKNLPWKLLRKQLGGCTGEMVFTQSGPTKSVKQTNRSRKDILTYVF